LSASVHGCRQPASRQANRLDRIWRAAMLAVRLEPPS
jgi:hypothetical protein